MGAVILLVVVVVLPALFVRLVVWPPSNWKRWRKATRPVRRYFMPSRYDRNGRPKSTGSDQTRQKQKLVKPPSSSDRR